MPKENLEALENAIFSKDAKNTDQLGIKQLMEGGQKIYKVAPAFLQLDNYLYGKYKEDQKDPKLQGSAIAGRLKDLELTGIKQNLNFPDYYSDWGQITPKAKRTLGAELDTKENTAAYAVTFNRNMAQYFKQLIEPIYLLHENGLVHRDLNPNNVFIYEDSSFNPVLKIGDLDTTSKMSEPINIHTPNYASDEIKAEFKTKGSLLQLSGAQRKKADEYNLGITLSKLLGTNTKIQDYEKLQNICNGLMTGELDAKQAYQQLSDQPLKKVEETTCDTTSTEQQGWLSNPISFIKKLWYGKPAEKVTESMSVTSSTLEEKNIEAPEIQKSHENPLINLLQLTKDFYQLLESKTDADKALSKAQALYEAQNNEIKKLYELSPNHDVKEIIKSIKQIQRSIPDDLKQQDFTFLKADKLLEIVKNAIAEYKIANDIKDSKEEGRHGRNVFFLFRAQIWGGIRNAEDLLARIEGNNNKSEVLKTILDHIESGPGRQADTSFRTILKDHLEAYTGARCENLRPNAVTQHSPSI